MSTVSPHVAEILTGAYDPCPGFSSSCVEMRWHPGSGHVPRGFFGATGELSEVELILVVAEPGDPHVGERHTGLESAYSYATAAFRDGKDQFHRNVRKILDMCWPGVQFEQQTRKVWLTESVLCSARVEGGRVSQIASRACGQRYLLPQLKLFPNALVVALGGKARDRLRSLGMSQDAFLAVYAVAPPGCNRQQAAESWNAIAETVKRRAQTQLS